MPTAPLSRVEAQRRADAIEAALRAGYRPPGSSFGSGLAAIAIAAKTLGISRKTLSTSFEAIETAGVKINWSLYQPPDPASDPPPREARRLRDNTVRLRHDLDAALRELNAMEDLRQALFGLTSGNVAPPKWAAPTKKDGKDVCCPVLFASDLQFGEVISATELDGVNEYNVEIASARFRRMIEKTVSLSFNYTVNPKYPGLIYFRGGDSVSGDIHEELRETNELKAIPAVRGLVDLETWAIRTLAAQFGRVFVVSVPGNHGRVTVKPHSKRYATVNYDTVVSWWLESLFKDDSRVMFWTPESGEAVVPIMGFNVLLTHGDRIGSRGGMGFIGPAATITRGMKKVHDFYATLGVHLDWIMVGHFHTRLELEYGFSNGSPAGVSEYSRDGRLRPAAPEQWLFVIHPEHGIIERRVLLLEPRPKQAKALWDAAKFKGLPA